MKRGLLIVNDRQFFLDLKSTLPLAGYQPVARTENGLEALRLVQRFEPDIIFMSWDIKALTAADLLQNLISQNLCPVIVGIHQEDINTLPEITQYNPDNILVYPFRAIDLVTTILCTEQRFAQFHDQKTKIEKLQNELKIRKTIYQALLILIQKLGYDEETAYSKLRQQAMTRRKSLPAIALDVIRENGITE
jgi:two-component system, response regulator PdtaR